MLRERHRRFNVARDHAVDARHADLLHRLFKRFAVFRFEYGLGVRAEHGNAHSFQKAVLVKLRSKVQTRLAAERSQKAVGPLLFYDAL
ncbi:hypothetical protein SDC9_160905 [bioreactor metagenome]|uniref:Uncharacterized protein n=1 Tax=bioreactor metagenome TaxID=1076179 RepID=A0A645FN06_9ZZZZ